MAVQKIKDNISIATVYVILLCNRGEGYLDKKIFPQIFMQNDLVILTGDEINTLLLHKERIIIEIVRKAYIAHANQKSYLPHSIFLRFPENSANRIIGLPAYIGDEFCVSGIKWVSSFPENIKKGIDRASAIILLNSVETGIPFAMLEGSIISAKRTAAGAALAAQTLVAQKKITNIGMIGCGVINFETLRFLLVVFPTIKQLTVFDIAGNRASQFAKKCQFLKKTLQVIISKDVATILAKNPLIIFATTAGSPYVADLSFCNPDTVIIHTSLRDIAPEAILQADNIVDDVDHVNREKTSIHLAFEQAKNLNFVRGTIGEAIQGKIRVKQKKAVTIYSAFGLGVLDLAVSKYVYETAIQDEIGSRIASFRPLPWRLKETQKNDKS